MKSQFLIFLLLIVTLNLEGQIKSRIIDIRDSSSYKTIIVDSIEWMSENLNFNSQESYIYPQQCDSCGRLYKYESLENVCPTEFRLPSKDEWNQLFKNLGGKLVIKEFGIYFHNIEDSITSPNFLNLKYCGFFRPNPFNEIFEREFSLCGKYGAYWHSNNDSLQLNGIHFEKSNWIGTVEGDEETGFSVRCIRILKNE